MMVAPGRVELPTFGLGNRCSIHLSYGAAYTGFGLRLSGFSKAAGFQSRRTLPVYNGTVQRVNTPLL
jgi:hypothetical protein